MQRDFAIQDGDTTINIEEYQEKILDLDVAKHLKKSEKDRKNGKTKDARTAVREMMSKY